MSAASLNILQSDITGLVTTLGFMHSIRSNFFSSQMLPWFDNEAEYNWFKCKKNMLGSPSRSCVAIYNHA